MSPWPLAVRLATRELRHGGRGFLLFFLCLALGVAAIAAVTSLRAAVEDALRTEARPLLGGDLEVRFTQRSPTAEQAAFLRQTSAATSAVVEMRAMARRASGDGQSVMVELKAVDALYPLFGDLILSPPRGVLSLLADEEGRWGAVVDPSLLARLGVVVGDSIRVGAATFVIRGLVEREPDRVASVAAFGPRLMISAGALPGTGLIQPGSLYRHTTRIVLPAGETAERWRASALAAFPDAGWQIRGTGDAAPGVQRFVERLALFLGFAALTTLLIGGLGIAGAVRTHLERRMQTIAILRCVGASGNLIMAIYLFQVMLVAAAAILVGLAIGALSPLLLAEAISGLLPMNLPATVHPRALTTAASLGGLTAFTFSLWPLAQAREVPAAHLFRSNVTPPAGRPRASFLMIIALAAAALLALAVFSLPDPRFGGVFVAAAALTLLVLRAAASAIAQLARRLPRAGSAAIRLAVSGLHRPGGPTGAVLISLGTGLTVLAAVALIDANMRAQIGARLPTTVPAFFFLDIQDDQRSDFDRTVHSVAGVEAWRRVPMLMGRIVALDGVPVEQAKVAPEALWALRGDRALTYAATAPEGSNLEAGTWWPEDYAGEPLISLDAALARGFGVGIGGTLTLNILGSDVTARIASLRRVEWRSVPFDFAIIFAPRTLEAAPHGDIAAVYAPPAVEAELQRAVAQALPNVTAIRTRDAIESAAQLLAKIGLGARAAAAVTVIAGILVLAGAIAGDRKRREHETVLFKMLGATRWRIAAIQAFEAAVLGSTAAALAALLGTGMAWAATTKMLRFEWTFDGPILVTTIAIGATAALAIGLVVTWCQLGRSTTALLRND
jgi:putative ABC transport system permease protein